MIIKLKKSRTKLYLLLYVIVLILMMILLTSCGKTKYIYKTEIKELEVVKLIPVDTQLTESIPVPYWKEVRKPTYLDLKKLYIDIGQNYLDLKNQKDQWK